MLTFRRRQSHPRWGSGRSVFTLRMLYICEQPVCPLRSLSHEHVLRLCTAATFNFRVFAFRNVLVSRDAPGRGMQPLPPCSHPPCHR